MHHVRRLLAALILSITAAQVTNAAQNSYSDSRIDFRDESIYFMITTRFYDGDPHNNVLCWDNQACQIQTGDPCWRGDFAGVIDKLDYIKALGFTAIWITPVVQNASGYDYHGYHAMDFSHVDLRYESHQGKGKYGGSERDVDFQTLIDAAHAKGIKIILDIVLNHTGNFGEENLCKEFERSQNILNQADINQCMLPQTLSQGGVLDDDYLNDIDTQYAKRLKLMKNTDGQNHDTNNYWHHFANFNWDLPNRWWAQIAGDCVDLNTENPAVAEYLVQCYGSFIQMGVDGFRIDTSGHIGRLTFNSYFIPEFQRLGEQYKSKRLNEAPFFIYGEVCARFGGVKYRDQSNLSPYYYTWASAASDVNAWKSVTAQDWANVYVKEGADPLLNMVACEKEPSIDQESNNTFMVNGAWHEPDYSQSSGFNVIDFPVHYNFTSASSAFGMASGGDKYYNDATYNVVYVDSHDYGPQPSDNVRFSGSDAQWAENLSLMFTFRGIPCIYYGSEIGFRRGATIDNGPNGPLSDTGRAYFGGYITGDVEATDFGTYTASGNVAATLSHDLSQHLIRLNKIRQACPALRRGQWTAEGCSGTGIAFRRACQDSYALVCLNGGATFTNCPAGTYTDLVTGQTYTGGGTITVTAPSNQGQLRVLVKDYSGKSGAALLGGDGKFIYATASTSAPALSYDGLQEAGTDMYITMEDALGEAGVSFSPNGGSFVSESREVTAYLNECKSGWYSINGGEHVSISASGTTFTLGQDDPAGTTYTITWGAISNDDIEKSGTLTFAKLGTYTPAIVSEDEISVFYETDQSAVGIWVWNETTKANYTGGVWNSKPNMTFMGLSSEGKNIFKWTYKGTETTLPTNVIFLPGGTQSADLTYTNHGYYVNNVSQKVITLLGEDDENNGGDDNNGDDDNTGDDEENTTESTIYFSNTGNWSNVYLWAWTDKTNFFTTWPGQQVTDKTSEGYYYYTFKGTAPANIIWNNGSGTQTNDLTFKADAIYCPTGDTGQTYSADDNTDDENDDNTDGDDENQDDNTDNNGYGLKQNIQDGVILHCFDWTAAQVEAEIENIAKAGFTAVQLSPVHEREGASAWYMAYQPYDFKVGNSIASVASLTSLCTAAHEVGVKVIVDVIANHTNGDLKWVAERLQDHSLYHNDPTKMNDIDYSSRYSITHDDMGIQDLATETEAVQTIIKAYVAELKSCGVDGIRWDAAKHIGLPSEGDSFWQNVPDQTMYNYGEILDGTGGDDSKLFPEYQTYISITDNKYGNGLADGFAGGNVPSSIGAFNQRGANTSKLVYWGESHDTYANDNGESKYKSQNAIDRAYAIAAGNNGATALYFSRPFETEKDKIRLGVKGSTHFTAPEVAQVNHCHNLCAGEPNYYVHTNSVGAQVRKSGCIIATGNGQAQSVNFANGDGLGGWLAPGTYTDRVAGGTFTVTAATISGQVGSTGIAVIYEGNSSPAPVPDDIYTPEVTEGEVSCFVETTAQTVKIWAWDSNENNYTGDWVTKPDMERMGVNAEGRYIYKWTYDGSLTTVPEGVIFVCDGTQSDDLTFTNHGYYINNVLDHVVMPTDDDDDYPYAAELQALRQRVSEAQSLCDNSTEGTAVGQYEAGSRELLQAVIDEVNDKISDDMELTVIEQCMRQINTALELFAAKQVTAEQVVDTDLSAYTEVIYVESAEAEPGQQLTLSVRLNNSQFAISAFQTDIFLPNGLTVARDDQDAYCVELSQERIADSQVQAFASNIISSGAVRLFFGAKTGQQLSGTKGEVATITVDVNDKLAAGTYAIMVKHTILNSAASDGTVEEHRVNDVITSHVTISDCLPGDVNGDHQVDIIDLTYVEAFILELDLPEFRLVAADLNDDLEINVTDWSLLCNKIFYNSNSAAQAPARNQEPGSDITLRLADAVMARGGRVEVPVSLSNADAAVASYQFDLDLPAGIQLTDVRTDGNRCHDQQVSWNQLASGSHRLLVTSMSDAPHAGTLGNVLYLTLSCDDLTAEGSYQLKLREAHLTHAGSVLRSPVTASRLSVTSPAAIETLHAEGAEGSMIYDLQGMHRAAIGKGVHIIRKADGTSAITLH